MIRDTLPTVDDKPVKVTISEEGFKSYRDKIKNGQSFEAVQEQRKRLLEGKLSPDMNRFMKWLAVYKTFCKE